MATLLVLTRQRHIVATAELVAADEWQVEVVDDWRDVVHSMIADEPPAAFLFSVEMLTDRGVRTLSLLARKGILVPSGVYVQHASDEALKAAWDVAEHEVDLVLDDPLAARPLRRFMRQRRDVATGIPLRYLGSQSPLVASLFRLLGSGPEALDLSVKEIARELGASRSVLYEALKRVGAPSIGRCQMLYRLLPAIRVLRMGGSSDDAAHSARVADATTLRRALKRHFQLSISDVRDIQSVASLVIRWMVLNGERTVVLRTVIDSHPAEDEAGRPRRRQLERA